MRQPAVRVALVKTWALGCTLTPTLTPTLSLITDPDQVRAALGLGPLGAAAPPRAAALAAAAPATPSPPAAVLASQSVRGA